MLHEFWHRTHFQNPEVSYYEIFELAIPDFFFLLPFFFPQKQPWMKSPENMTRINSILIALIEWLPFEAMIESLVWGCLYFQRRRSSGWRAAGSLSRVLGFVCRFLSRCLWLFWFDEKVDSRGLIRLQSIKLQHLFMGGVVNTYEYWFVPFCLAHFKELEASVCWGYEVNNPLVRFQNEFTPTRRAH